MSLPINANVEPTREVLRRIYMGFGGMSFHNDEPKLIAACEELTKQGWLKHDGGRFVTCGRTYQRYVATERMSVRELKDL